METWNGLIAISGALLVVASLATVLQFSRGRLGLTEFIDFLLLTIGILAIFFGPWPAESRMAATSVWMIVYYGVWHLMLKKTVRRRELERAVAEAPQV